MKALIASLVLVSAYAHAQQAAPEPTLTAGSEVSLAALEQAKWIQGEMPKEFKPGDVYLFECWATWCGPCLAVIPHVNDLHKKYQDKGLRVFGINVWEDGVEKVEKFVKGKGDGMSYPVAYTGKGSAFEEEWLKASGVRGIPRAFVVRDGKLVMHCHPSQLTEEVIDELLSGEEGAVKAAERIRSVDDRRNKTGLVLREFRLAGAKGDTEGMAAKIDELEALDPKSIHKTSMKLALLVEKQDWPAATAMLAEVPAGQERMIALSTLVSRVGVRGDEDMPKDFLSALANAYGGMLKESPGGIRPMNLVSLSRLEWMAGDKEQAVASAQSALAAVKETKDGRSLPVEPFERFAKALEGGSMPEMADFAGWLNSAMKAAREAKE